MTPRPHARTRRTAAIYAFAFAGLLALAGCDPRTLFYFLQPYEPTIPPPEGSPSLKGKKVLVVASAAAGTQREYVSIERELVRDFINRLRQGSSHLDVVNSDKVWEWVEAHPNWTDPAEIAEKYEADLAIYLELEEFQLQAPGDLNMLHGTSRIHIKVYERDYPKNARGKSLRDQPKEAKVVYDEYQDTEFPKRGAMPAESGSSRGKFKNMFLKVVSTECSWHFIEHAPEDTIEQEKFLK